MLKRMKRGFVIVILLVLICLGAGAWASAASHNISQGTENGFVHLLANGLATLARIPAREQGTSWMAGSGANPYPGKHKYAFAGAHPDPRYGARSDRA